VQQKALTRDLADLYLAAADLVRRWFAARGVPLKVSVERPVVRREHPRTWVESTSHMVNVLEAMAPLPDPPPDLSALEQRLERCADCLIALSGSSLPFWSVFPANPWPFSDSGPVGVDFDSQPKIWLRCAVLFPALRSHLALLDSVADADESHAMAFAEEVISLCTAQDLEYELTVPLAGVELGSERLEVGAATIRRLAAAEQGAILQHPQPSWMSFIHWPDTVLELIVSGPRTTQFLDSQAVVMPIATAFSLHGVGIAGVYVRQGPRPSWIGHGISYAPLNIPHRHGEPAQLDLTLFQAIVETSSMLPKFHLLKPESANDLALHRFVLGVGRESGADSIVDFAIALESILLPYDEDARHSDLGYRFRLHGACYLADDLAERQALARQLTSLYDVRSRLVHGGRYPARAEVEETKNSARDLSRRCLLKAVHEGFPIAKTFKDLLLS
jgi:hypothetical protein